jgi:calcium-dependent protein kinase
VSSILTSVLIRRAKKILFLVGKQLIDFGLSKVYCDSARLTDGVGTIYTMAPEVLSGDYSQKADIWSVGVIAYMLLSSQMPFYGRKRLQIVDQILHCHYDFRGRRWKRVSDQAKRFIQDLLVLDPNERLDASTAMSSVWLNRRFAATTRGPHLGEEAMARQAMVRYAGYTKLKKMALMVVAHKSTTEEIGILRKVFQKYDLRRDGSIAFDEFCEALGDSGLSTDDLRSMFDAVVRMSLACEFVDRCRRTAVLRQDSKLWAYDVAEVLISRLMFVFSFLSQDLDGSGRIRYTEFLAATIEAQGAISEERLAEAFDRLDSDDSGYISAENLAEILGDDFPREEIDEILREVGLTEDNQVSYSDFLSLWEHLREDERSVALHELGHHNPPGTSSSLSSGGQSSCDGNSLNPSLDSIDDREATMAHASFLIRKHSFAESPRHHHVGFEDKVIAIAKNDVTQQQHLEVDPTDHANPVEGVHL